MKKLFGFVDFVKTEPARSFVAAKIQEEKTLYRHVSILEKEINDLIESEVDNIDEGLTDGAVEYIKNVLRSKKAVSAQNKVNKVKYKAAGADDNKVRATINQKADDLQKIVDGRWGSADEITKSALAKAKIEGGIKALEIQLQNTTAESEIERLETSLKNAEERLKKANTEIAEIKNKHKDEQSEIKDPENKEEVKDLKQDANQSDKKEEPSDKKEEPKKEIDKEENKDSENKEDKKDDEKSKS